jgi:hypothetical protein
VAVTFTAAGVLAGNATTPSQNITSPAVAVGDYVLIAVIINKGRSAAISPPDGTWTEIVFGSTDCTTAADDHSYVVYWKRVTSDAGGTAYTFTKDIDDNVLFAGIISTWSGAVTSGDPLDGTAVGVTPTVGAADNVSFPAFDPTETDSHIIYVAIYGNDNTTFDAAMSSDTNPDCTKRFDVETSTGTDVSIALTSGDTTDGSSIASRTWASASTTDAGNTGIVFGIKPQATAATPRLLALLGVGL